MTTDPEGEGRETAVHRTHKSEAAFRTISEVAAELDVQQHVLRFWETRFPVIQPLKRGGGRRYYRPEDVALLRAIRDRLYGDGFTIKGVRKLLAENGVEGLIAGGAAAETPKPRERTVREPDLPFEIPADGASPKLLTPMQSTAIAAAIGRLGRLKTHLDQVVEGNLSGNPVASPE
jgi:DNA-binding transcriptional MerR regulator